MRVCVCVDLPGLPWLSLLEKLPMTAVAEGLRCCPAGAPCSVTQPRPKCAPPCRSPTRARTSTSRKWSHALLPSWEITKWPCSSEQNQTEGVCALILICLVRKSVCLHTETKSHGRGRTLRRDRSRKAEKRKRVVGMYCLNSCGRFSTVPTIHTTGTTFTRERFKEM